MTAVNPKRKTWKKTLELCEARIEEGPWTKVFNDVHLEIWNPGASVKSFLSDDFKSCMPGITVWMSNKYHTMREEI